MTKPNIKLVVKDYDYLAPLLCGDVEAEGVRLEVERDTEDALDRTLADPSIDAGELSFCLHVMRVASGDDSFVGIPFFAYRAFRQRCFFVRRDSGLKELSQLQGKRVGTSEWAATGNVWTRALLPEQGVPLRSIQWWVGPLDEPKSTLPPYAQEIPQGQTLPDMLLRGELDAFMSANPPQGFYEADCPIVRLLDDYQSAERDYYRRTHLYPPQHIIGIRRALFDRHPWVAQSLFEALERSRVLWQERRCDWYEASPWFLTELEEVTALMGHDWQPNGFEANQAAIQVFCDELLAQGLIAASLDAAAVFAEFLQVTNSLRTAK